MNQAGTEKLYIVCTSAEPNNVIFGHAGFAKAAGMDPVFVFPNRVSAQDFSAYYSGYQTLCLNFTFTTTSAFAYFRSVILLLLHVSRVFLFHREAKYFLAIDLPGTIACLFLKSRGASIHTLVNDNFSARYEVAPIAFAVLKIFEASIFRLVSSSCIFPDKTRYVLLGSPRIRRAYYVPNILSDSYAPPYEGSNSKKLIVMFCGWLVATRGMELLANIVEHTADNVEFLLVGSGDETILASLADKGRVKYLGHVSRDENLALMSKVDINVAFYSPRILINRFALPQKIYDSLMIGCPLFVNSEVEMSTALSKSGSCFTANYFDVQAVCSKLNELAKNKEPLYRMSKAMISYRNQYANFKLTQLAGLNVYRDILAN